MSLILSISLICFCFVTILTLVSHAPVFIIRSSIQRCQQSVLYGFPGSVKFHHKWWRKADQDHRVPVSRREYRSWRWWAIMLGWLAREADGARSTEEIPFGCRWVGAFINKKGLTSIGDVKVDKELQNKNYNLCISSQGNRAVSFLSISSVVLFNISWI